MMDHKPRPYRGRAAELAELDALTTSAINSLPQNDTVLEAGKKCLLIGGLTAPFLIGFPFLSAAFVLGIYAMATDRLKQGMKISLLAIVLMVVIPVVLYLIFLTFFMGIAMAFFQGTKHLPAPSEAVPFEKFEPLQQLTSVNPNSLNWQPQTTFEKREPRQQSTSFKSSSLNQKTQTTTDAQNWESQAISTQKSLKSDDGKRQDHVIPRGELTHVPGFGTVNINHNHAYIYFSTFKGQKPREIRKVRGLHPTDTNRTLLSRSGSVSLYFVDTIVGADKVQVAVVPE